MSNPDLKKDRNKVIFAVCSNLFALCASLFLGLILPKFTSIETYANYKTYTLYSGFLGLFHFGFINGIYLKYGGKDFEQLPKEKFRIYTYVLMISQTAVQALLFPVLLIVSGTKDLLSPFFFIILNIFLVNVNCYFTLVDQFTRRFVLDAAVQILQRTLTVLIFILLIAGKCEDHRIYLTAVTAVNLISFIVLAVFNREIIFGRTDRSYFDLSDIKKRIKHGFFIMISEYIGLFIVGVDSIIVNIFFMTEQFSVYSFAVSVINLMFQLTAIVSKFIFPYLKRMDSGAYPALYGKMKKFTCLVSAGVAGIYFPAAFLIPRLLPKYNESVVIIAVLSVSVVFKGLHELVCSNFFKVLGAEKEFVITNIIAIIIGIVSDTAVYLIFGNMLSLALASVLSFVIWFVISDIMLKKRMGIRSGADYILIAAVSAVFLLCTLFAPAAGFALFYLVLAAVSAVFIIRLKNKADTVPHK